MVGVSSNEIQNAIDAMTEKRLERFWKRVNRRVRRKCRRKGHKGLTLGDEIYAKIMRGPDIKWFDLTGRPEDKRC